MSSTNNLECFFIRRDFWLLWCWRFHAFHPATSLPSYSSCNGWGLIEGSFHLVNKTNSFLGSRVNGKQNVFWLREDTRSQPVFEIFNYIWTCQSWSHQKPACLQSTEFCSNWNFIKTPEDSPFLGVLNSIETRPAVLQHLLRPVVFFFLCEFN